MGVVQRDSFRITVISYAGAAIGYLNKILLFTNFLETEQVGLANLIVSLSLIYAQFAALGSRNIVIRFFPFFNNPKNHHHGFLFGMIAIATGGFVLATLLLLIVREPFLLLYRDSSPLLVEYAFYLIPLALANVYYNLFEAYLRSLYDNLLPSLAHEIILRILITLSITLFATGIITFPLFVLIYVVANCMPAVLLVLYTAAKGWLLIKPVYSPLLRRLGKIMLVYGLFSLLTNLSTFLFVSIDGLMVAGMIDLGAAGIYTTMVFLTSIMLIPFRSMVKVSAPIVAQMWKNRAIGEIQSVSRKASAGSMVVGAALFVMIWVNIDAIFQLMPEAYSAGRHVFLILGVGKLFDMSAALTSTILVTSKKYRFDLVFTLAMVAAAIAFNYLLIPVFGINGAALASMITLVLFNLLRILFIRYHFGIIPFRKKQIWIPVIITIIVLMTFMIPATGRFWLDVISRSTVAMLLFLIPVKMLHVSPELEAWLNRMLRKLKSFYIG